MELYEWVDKSRKLLILLLKQLRSNLMIFTVNADGYSVNINMDHGEFQKVGEMSTLMINGFTSPQMGVRQSIVVKLVPRIESRELYVPGKQGLNIIMIMTVMGIRESIHSETYLQ